MQINLQSKVKREKTDIPPSSVLAYWENHFQIKYNQNQACVKQYGVDKLIYRQKDCIGSIFMIIQGEVSIIYQQKELNLCENNIFGDFQPSLNIFRRITKAKAKVKCKVLQIPYDFFFNLKRHFQQKLLPLLSLKDNFIKYCLKKLYKLSKMRKNQTFLVKEGIGIILSGRFQLQKNLKIGNFRHRLQQGGYQFQIIKKHHSIGQLNQNQVFIEDVHCNSTEGQICYWNSEAVTFLKNNFEQFRYFFMKHKDRKRIHQQRIEQIQKIYWSNDKLKNSILPYQTPRYYSPTKRQQNRYSQQNRSSQQNVSSVKSLIRRRSILMSCKIRNSLAKSLQSRFQNKNEVENEQAINRDNIIQFYLDQQIRKKRLSSEFLKTPQFKKSSRFNSSHLKRSVNLYPEISQARNNQYLKRNFNCHTEAPYTKKINLQSETSQTRRSEDKIPQQFKHTKFKFKMFLKARNKFNSGFRVCQSIKTFKNGILIKKPALKILN